MRRTVSALLWRYGQSLRLRGCVGRISELKAQLTGCTDLLVVPVVRTDDPLNQRMPDHIDFREVDKADSFCSSEDLGSLNQATRPPRGQVDLRDITCHNHL